MSILEIYFLIISILGLANSTFISNQDLFAYVLLQYVHSFRISKRFTMTASEKNVVCKAWWTSEQGRPWTDGLPKEGNVWTVHGGSGVLLEMDRNSFSQMRLATESNRVVLFRSSNVEDYELNWKIASNEIKCVNLKLLSKRTTKITFRWFRMIYNNTLYLKRQKSYTMYKYTVVQ